ncbi:transporter substrate-binding domain-containing protein [Neiella sp. HB171785]|uniref:Transporter substrate-binding domain-containing protein n=1 Tax=Neiella litorisoli TaxID=2771431 RepID=A0A8J6UMI8_9GAMM|nr:transporter substrate-binding domain-containing protein [Neiella litorisoli]MBD1390945.1 transporter substrate-binding domain-containing protein [Neiella litorisoli]
MTSHCFGVALKFIKLLLLWVSVLATTPVLATVETIIANPVSKQDLIDVYNFELLNAALEITRADFGDYQLVSPTVVMLSKRIATELERGESLHIAASNVKESWKPHVITVPFPINKGLSSLRVFYATKERAEVLAQVRSIDQLKQFKFGQGQGWSTAKILQDHGFKVTKSYEYSTLPRMLQANRFDILMRSIREAVLEQDVLADPNSNIELVDNIAIYTYLPMYFHVTPKRPELAERLEVGLKRLDSAGEVEKLLRKHFERSVNLFTASERLVFYLENTNLEPGTYQRDLPYLLKTNLQP